MIRLNFVTMRSRPSGLRLGFMYCFMCISFDYDLSASVRLADFTGLNASTDQSMALSHWTIPYCFATAMPVRPRNRPIANPE
jgi:hypothetical protein